MIPTHLRILLATAPVDMRRSFDGLARAVVETLGEDPRARHSLFVFVNHKRDRIKVLWRDTTGWCLLYKRLDENVVALPTHIPDGATSVSVDAKALARLLDGVKPQNLETEREVAKKPRALALSAIDPNSIFLRLGQVVEDVPSLVHLTPLHHGAVTEDVADSHAQGLAAIDNDEGRAVHWQAALLQVAEKLLAGAGVPGDTLVEAEHTLASLTIDAECHHDDVLVDLQPVDHQHGEVEARQVGLPNLVETRLGHRNEATAHGAPAGASVLDVDII
jgi:transposase